REIKRLLTDTPAPAKENIFDYEQTIAQLGDDKTLFSELAAIFIEELPTLQQALSRAIEQQDIEAIRRSAHRLKGECLHFACLPLESKLSQIEQAAAAGNIAVITKQYHGVDELCQQLQAALIASKDRL
ncbi:hypothetical protein C9426_19250, partial [Serratia sp. S1B]